MRISILQGAFLPVPPLMGGAVEKIWFEMGKQFARQGHQVTHISRTYPGLPDDAEIDGVLHRRVRGHATPRSLPVLKLLDLLYTLRATRVMPEADIVVTNTFWAPLLLRSKHGKIYVSVERFPKGQMRLYHRAARLRVPSSAIRDKVLQELGEGASQRITLIPNPLPFRAEKQDHTRVKERTILYAGRIHPEKGLALLIEAFSRGTAEGWAEGWKLLLAGPWETLQGGGGESFKRMLSCRYTGPTIEWLGPVFESRPLQDLYRKASIFVYPSIAERGESFGLAALEAMARGAVPVVSNLNCFKDFIVPGSNGMVFDHDAHDAAGALASAMASLMSDSMLRRRMAAKAVQVNVTHSPERIAGLFLEDFGLFREEQCKPN